MNRILGRRTLLLGPWTFRNCHPCTDDAPDCLLDYGDGCGSFYCSSKGIQISQNSVGRKSGGFILNHDFGQHCKTRHQGLTHGSSGSSQTRNVIHVYVRICMHMYIYM